MKFADIKNDVAFRKIFGTQKKSISLISFLNAVLELEGENRIRRVTIIDPFLLPHVLGEKASIIDVKATDQKGRQFIVEMQVADKKGFDKRVQYYASRDYSTQIEKGEDYPKLRATYFIGILNFSFGNSKDYLSKHSIIEHETGDNLLSDIQFFFIQLTKFKKKPTELVTLIDKWTYFIKNAKKLSVIPENLEDEGLIKAYRDADKYTWHKDELLAYDNVSMREQDARGELEKAVEEAVEKAVGEAKIENQRETILKLHLKGKKVEEIADLLDIALLVVQEIIDEYEANR